VFSSLLFGHIREVAVALVPLWGIIHVSSLLISFTPVIIRNLIVLVWSGISKNMRMKEQGKITFVPVKNSWGTACAM